MNENRTTKELEAKIEAILFTLGEAVEGERIAAALEQDKSTIEEAINSLIAHYETEQHGLQIIKLDGSYQLCTRPELYETLLKITHVPKKQVLTDALLETLSIIAYKQPVTKQEIDAIRGVKSDHVVNKLVEYRLISEIGRMDAPGRPILFGTTEDFLRCFGISSIEDLPAVSTELVEDFKQEAEKEVAYTVEV